MTRDEAAKVAGENPDYLLEDLYDAIEKGDYPTWNVYVQVMEPAEAETYRWMPLPYMGSVAHKDKCLVLQGMFGLTAFKDYLQ